MYLQRKNFEKKKIEPMEVVNQQKAANMQKLLKENEEKKKIAQAVQNY